jgi:hypothetical protein
MSVSNYKYTADSGTVYQVTVPDDFAAALSMVAASGAEPFLDAAIAPRYANYIASATGQVRQAVIKTTGQFAAIPSPITVGGTSFTLRSAKGESIPATPTNVLSVQSLLQGPAGGAGPPGPQGPPGPMSYIFQYAGSDYTLHGPGSVNFFTFANVPAGKYLFVANATFIQSSGVAQQLRSWLSDTTHSVRYGGGYQVTIPGKFQSLFLIAYAELAAVSSMVWQLYNDGPSDVTFYMGPDGNSLTGELGMLIRLA